jgi:rod shape-determining protein MreC
MKKKSHKTYLLIFCSLLTLMSVPKDTTEKLRGSTVAMLAPTWNHLLAFKSHILTSQTTFETSSNISQNEIEKLFIENIFLKEEILHLKEIMQQEIRLIHQMNSALDDEESRFSTKTLRARHREELKKLLHINLEAIPAKVIFRSPDSWNSSFWINVGSATNEALGSSTIAKNSPVLICTSIIGVVDFVGKYQSRVKLITDSGLTPSVRAARGLIQKQAFNEKIYNIIDILKKIPDLLNETQQQELISSLESALQFIHKDEKNTYLAKGELYGASKPLWRSQRHLLKGIGFNYDFADGEGFARDLRTGTSLEQASKIPTIPILQNGDILVTTGMDGVFPPGLMVAEVAEVHPLKEGDYYYELDAIPTAGNFDELSMVFVIPPVNYDPNERPPAFGWK